VGWFDEEVTVGPYTVGTVLSNNTPERKRNSDQVDYYWQRDGKVSGYVQLTNRGELGFEIAWIQSDEGLLAQQMISHAERDLGFKMKVAGELTEEGYKATRAMLRFKGGKQAESILDLYSKHTIEYRGTDERGNVKVEKVTMMRRSRAGRRVNGSG
jgi:hypothetical protein